VRARKNGSGSLWSRSHPEWRRVPTEILRRPQVCPWLRPGTVLRWSPPLGCSCGTGSGQEALDHTSTFTRSSRQHTLLHSSSTRCCASCWWRLASGEKGRRRGTFLPSNPSSCGSALPDPIDSAWRLAVSASFRHEWLTLLERVRSSGARWNGSQCPLIVYSGIESSF